MGQAESRFRTDRKQMPIAAVCCELNVRKCDNEEHFSLFMANCTELSWPCLDRLVTAITDVHKTALKQLGFLLLSATLLNWTSFH